MSVVEFINHKIFQLKMSLPRKLQVKLAGGSPVVIRGRTLDPSLQLLANLSVRQPPIRTLPVDVARTKSAAGYAALSGPTRKNVMVREVQISGQGGPLHCRIYTPNKPIEKSPTILYFHPGGWVLGDLNTAHSYCTELCSRVGATVVSVDYRLAPENKFPAAVEDAITAYEWTLYNISQLGRDLRKVIVAGESAGANLAAVVCQQAKQQNLPLPLYQFLVSPVTDCKNRSISYQDYRNSFPLTSETMEWFIHSYLSCEADALDPRASPLLADNLEGLPSAIVITAGFDPLLDEGATYANRLQSAGVPVHYHCEDSSGHGINTMAGLSRSCKEASDRSIDLLLHALQVLKS